VKKTAYLLSWSLNPSRENEDWITGKNMHVCIFVHKYYISLYLCIYMHIQ
jgi:hypothetical protein